MPEYHNLRRADDGLITGERSATVLHALDDAIHTLEMFPYKSPNSQVFGNSLAFAVRKDIACRGAFNWNVVDIGNGDMRHLGSEDVRDVIVEYRNGISPSHWQGCESECSEWTLEGREVSRRFGDSAFVIADEQIHHSGAGATRELFGELFGKRRNTRMRYGDCIEFFERFYPAKSAVLFRNGKPATAIGRVRWFKYAGVQFSLNDFTDFVVYSGRYRYVALSPRFMGDSGDLYRREEVFAKMSSLGVVPSEAVLMENHEMMEQGALFIPQESWLMKRVEVIAALLRVATARREWRWARI